MNQSPKMIDIFITCFHPKTQRRLGVDNLLFYQANFPFFTKVPKTHDKTYESYTHLQAMVLKINSQTLR